MSEVGVSDERTHLVGEYRVYGIRWIQLIVYFLATFANAIHGLTFAPIESETATFYNITTGQVNALAFVFFFLYTIGTIISIWLSRKYSLRVIMIIGSILNLGVFIRLFSLINVSKGFVSLLIGQMFPATAAPFFLNTPALFAARWFAPNQRDIATSICSMASPLGLAIGSLVPSLLVTTDNPTWNEFLILLLSEGVFTVLTTILIIIIFRSDPPSPPSPSEEHHQMINIKEDLIKLMKNHHYLLLLFGFSIGLAIFNGLTTLLYQIIAPSGYTSDDAGIFGAVIIISGLFNAFIAGILMDKTHQYKTILKTLLVGAAASGIFFIIILQPNKVYPLGAAIGLMGSFLLPLLPVTYECAVECTYPIRAEWSTGVLMCIGNILGGIFIFLMQYLISLAPHYQQGHIFTPINVFFLSTFFLSLASLFAYRGPYLRLQAEKENNNTSTVNI